jgi:hypothetical protein
MPRFLLLEAQYFLLAASIWQAGRKVNIFSPRKAAARVRHQRSSSLSVPIFDKMRGIV